MGKEWHIEDGTIVFEESKDLYSIVTQKAKQEIQAEEDKYIFDALLKTADVPYYEKVYNIDPKPIGADHRAKTKELYFGWDKAVGWSKTEKAYSKQSEAESKKIRKALNVYDDAIIASEKAGVDRGPFVLFYQKKWGYNRLSKIKRVLFGSILDVKDILVSIGKDVGIHDIRYDFIAYEVNLDEFSKLPETSILTPVPDSCIITRIRFR